MRRTLFYLCHLDCLGERGRTGGGRCGGGGETEGSPREQGARAGTGAGVALQ